jgi:uncharacterized protein YdiU (UPF0061 family)
MQLGFQHSYAALPDRFYARVNPAPVADPQLAVFNAPLAGELGLDPGTVAAGAAAMFSGNQLPEDAMPIAMAYAGHQFGGFVPRLGDGRAILLGEIRDRTGTLRDVQLKGAGLTPFSRDGDGRAALGPMLREYLISEAMHALGIPTTRSLAVVTTGEPVYRDTELPGAVLTRVAASHVRVGSFQYFAARGDEDGVRALLDYVIARHFPAARVAELPALAVLTEVARRQGALIARWMLVGFIHGVMNTDNMALSGETIDYGPCAFMDHYDPKTVFSSIDRGGRYAFANQAAIAQWNLARFAETLLFLLDPDAEKAVQLATAVLEGYFLQFDTQLIAGMRRKLGLVAEAAGDIELIQRLLALMQQSQADYTLTFRGLAAVAENAAARQSFRELFASTSDIDQWLADWQQRLAGDPQSTQERVAGMRTVNPAFIPRNHRVHAALNAAEIGDYGPFRTLLAIVQRPFDEQPEFAEYTAPPLPAERVLKTFCGT